jgi:microcin C transport system substrate-binding protein
MAPALRAALILAALLAQTPADRGHAEEATVTSHGLSTFGDLKYPPGFPHFDYVNPAAPKGGVFSTWAFGTFDSLNPFILKGNAATGLGGLFDTLMTGSDDEVDALYGLLAESIEYPADRQWAIFTLRPEARFSDGTPVTAEDVVFTYNILIEKGEPSYKLTFKDFETVEALDTHRVKFTFREGALTRDLPAKAAGLPVFSKAFWATRDFAESTIEPPLGSGPYLVSKVEPGRTIVYRRRDDYWGKDLPVNIGINNFDEIRFEYYTDYTAAFEGFKGGAYNFREEFFSKVWAENYTFPALEQGWVKRETVADNRPSGTQGFWFNMRRDKFKDPRVREAIAMMFNFEWSNKSLFFDLYDRTTSFWDNSTLKAEGLPSPEEMALLEPLREHLPESIFSGPAYVPPVWGTEAVDRRALRQAGRLLDEAGWPVVNGKRTNAAGEVLTVEFIDDSPSSERIILPYVENLKRLGIDASLRMVDAAQEAERRKKFDYDIISARFVFSLTPGEELEEIFGSASADVPGSVNLTGLANPAIDALIRKVADAGSREEMTVAVRALDRALRALHIWVPNWNKASHWIAYLDHFGRPEPLPTYSMGAPGLWWWDEAKAAKLREAGALR